MPRSNRPLYPKKDANHKIVVNALEELGFPQVDNSRRRYTCMVQGQFLIALDISELPGQIDWLIISERGWILNIEVKKDEKEGLTDGETSWGQSVGLVVAWNKDKVKYAILEKIAEWKLL